MDLRGFRMIVHVGSHPEYRGLGDYFGTGKPRPKRSGVRRTLEQNIALAESLAKEHGGVLPRVSWIQKNYSGLASAMHKHPKRFEHIPQERLRKTFRTLEQWVAFAEVLAKDRGGILPHASWIQKNYSGLYNAMQKHSKRFEHIPQEKPQGHFRNLEQNVALAESLAKEHGGVLPHAKWIQKNHQGLASAMWKHPKRFEHVPQDKPQGHHRDLEQWVVFAEALANEHGGILPCADWIWKNHSGLAIAMRRHPNRFEHIPQEKPYGHRRTLEEWVLFTEALAKEHGGVLPSTSWIKKNHPGLARAMWKHPKRFEHVPQDKPQGHHLNLDQWVAFAKALSEEHGGVLPCVSRIVENHPGLHGAMQRNPEGFSGLRQEVRDSRGRIIGYRVLGEDKEAE